MGFFSPSKPQVSKTEFQKVKRQLHAEGVPEHVLDKFEQEFSGHLDESGYSKGIDRKELEQGIKRLKSKSYDYGISKNQIKKAEEELKKRL
ncbi:MAG: hypothetical protein Q7K16_02495 [Candidatus Azambacteria bacterium]|nr:hypothetical protein [Candidatus Azambacteria bacterium]